MVSADGKNGLVTRQANSVRSPEVAPVPVDDSVASPTGGGRQRDTASSEAVERAPSTGIGPASSASETTTATRVRLVTGEDRRERIALCDRCTPGRIDILTELTGLTFEEAWPGRDAGRFGELTVDFLGRDAFIRNKRATDRRRDLGDIEGL